MGSGISYPFFQESIKESLKRIKDAYQKRSAGETYISFNDYTKFLGLVDLEIIGKEDMFVLNSKKNMSTQMFRHALTVFIKIDKKIEFKTIYKALMQPDSNLEILDKIYSIGEKWLDDTREDFILKCRIYAHGHSYLPIEEYYKYFDQYKKLGGKDNIEKFGGAIVQAWGEADFYSGTNQGLYSLVDNKDDEAYEKVWKLVINEKDKQNYYPFDENYGYTFIEGYGEYWDEGYCAEGEYDDDEEEGYYDPDLDEMVSIEPDYDDYGNAVPRRLNW